MKMIFILTAAVAVLSQGQTNTLETIPAEKRLEITAVPTNDAVSMAISPDGKKLVFSGLSNGRIRLWLRNLDTGDQRTLPGTEDGTYPFWSPDSQSIGFFGDIKLKRLDVETGETRTIAENATWGAGGTWNRDGTILFGRQGQYTLMRVSNTGGPIERVTQIPGPQQLVHVHPQFLPDGRHFLYYVQGVPSARGIYIGELGSLAGRRLVDSEAAGVYASGRLLFVENGTLFAQQFDPVRLTLSGSRTKLAEHVPLSGRSAAGFSAAGNNIIFRSGLSGSVQQLTWFDRSGKKLGTVGEPYLSGSGAPSISPDGKSVVVNRLVDGSGDIWTVDVQTGEFKQFTSDPANDTYPIWSSDSRRIAFSSNRTNASEMYIKPVGVTAVESLLFGVRANFRHPMDWSRDGRYLIYRTGFPDLWALKLDGLEEIPILPQGNLEIRWPQFSPDGRWIAFQSKVSGRNEVYIHGPFSPPELGQPFSPISAGGGHWVRWSDDGKELFYATPGGTLMAVSIDVASDGRSFKAGEPKALFTSPMLGSPDNTAQQFMVSENGQRFLVVSAPFEESRVHVILNWKP